MKTFNKFMLLLLFLFIFTPGISNSQSLHFCQSVDEYGEPVNESEYIKISSDGGYLDFLVRTDSRIGVNSVYFKIYKIKNGKEIYDNTIWQDVEPEWTWFWKEIIFYEDGVFNVYVYDENGLFLASGTIEVNYR